MSSMFKRTGQKDEIQAALAASPNRSHGINTHNLVRRETGFATLVNLAVKHAFQRRAASAPAISLRIMAYGNTLLRGLRRGRGEK